MLAWRPSPRRPRSRHEESSGRDSRHQSALAVSRVRRHHRGGSMSDVYDVVIVGTGAGGSTMALELATRGLKVLSLEYGPNVAPGQLMSMEMFYQAFRRVPYKDLKPWLHGRPE